MNRQKPELSLIPLTLAALLTGGVAPESWAGAGAAGLPFGEADVFLELNHTDGDLGLHALVDGDAWKELVVTSPNGSERLRVSASGSLRRHGLTELFFESAEPPLDQLPPSAFFRRFPEGVWGISGITVNDEELESTDLLRHVLPAPPENILLSGVPAAENCDADPLPSVSEPVVISWDPVTSSHPEIGRTGKIKVVRYQLVVEREEPTPLTLSVELPPNVTEFELPEGFLGLADEFKFEILVREASGNQTAIESCFEVE